MLCNKMQQLPKSILAYHQLLILRLTQHQVQLVYDAPGS